MEVTNSAEDAAIIDKRLSPRSSSLYMRLRWEFFQSGAKGRTCHFYCSKLIELMTYKPSPGSKDKAYIPSEEDIGEMLVQLHRFGLIDVSFPLDENARPTVKVRFLLADEQ